MHISAAKPDDVLAYLHKHYCTVSHFTIGDTHSAIHKF